MINLSHFGQRLLPNKAHGFAYESHGLIDEGHGSDDWGIFIPLSTREHETGKNDPLVITLSTPNSLLMAQSSEDRRKAIKRFMAAHDLRPKPWAQAAGLSPKTLANFLNRKSESVTHTSLEKLARAADATIAEMIGEKPSQPRPGREIVTVQGLNVQGSMGGGMEISEEPAGEPFYFRKNFIDRISRGRPVRLRVIELIGDSMYPTMHDGDVALVDLNSKDVTRTPGIYCLFASTGLTVKRVSAVAGPRPKLRVQSDNPIYGSDEVDADDVGIVGRVLWRGGMV